MTVPSVLVIHARLWEGVGVLLEEFPMDLSPVGVALGALLFALLALYFTRFRGSPRDVYLPAVAWTRAGIYFTCCFLASWGSGAMGELLSRPIVTQAQLADPNWKLFTAACTLFVIGAYWVLWPYYTVTLNRRRYPTTQLLFGLLWGLSSAQLFLTAWHVSNQFGWPTWGAWIATWLVLGAWQPNWQSAFWDIYIAPEHDTVRTMRIKALGCHIPNLTLCLTYLAYYENWAIFAALQTSAFISASWGMRFPAPWAPASEIDAPRYAVMGGLERASGYESVDPLTDPFVPFERPRRAAALAQRADLKG